LKRDTSSSGKFFLVFFELLLDASGSEKLKPFPHSPPDSAQLANKMGLSILPEQGCGKTRSTSFFSSSEPGFGLSSPVRMLDGLLGIY